MIRRAALAGLLLAGTVFAGNPVERLKQRLESGEVRLEYQEPRGYLDSLLEALEISPLTQTLVFSKTSAQFRLISPRSPRALYFNDDVYVGWVRGGPILEISTADTKDGAAFYSLNQEPGKAQIVRDQGQCLQCHESGRTARVPGHMTRSLFVDSTGQPELRMGGADVDHTTPLSERFGGWLVTDAVFEHRGNLVLTPGSEKTEPFDFSGVSNPDDYLRSDSSVLAHLLLAHETQTHNRIARAGLEARKAIEYRDNMRKLFGEASEETEASVGRRIENPAEELLEYILFSEEAPLPPGLNADTPLAKQFSQRGPLYELDLERRLFRVPLSYLVLTEAFDALPDETHNYLRRRLQQILSGEDDSEEFAHLTPADLTAIERALRTEKPSLLEPTGQ